MPTDQKKSTSASASSASKSSKSGKAGKSSSSSGSGGGKKHTHGDGKKKKRRRSNNSNGTRRGLHKRGSDVRIMTVSWNMGNAMSDCFDRILPFEGGSYDIIALGLQESTYSIKAPAPSSLASNSQATGDLAAAGGGGGTGSGKEQSSTSRRGNQAQEDSGDCVLQLLAQVQEVLKDDFYMVAHNKRAQMQQLIFARNDLRSRVSHIKLYAENTGFFHIFPNKGGLCVSLSVDATRLAFISCHLAAHEGVDKCAIRNSSVQEILSSVTTESDTVHHTFFMGDMNYRCTLNKDTPASASSDKDKAKEKAEKKAAKGKKGAPPPTAVNMDDDSDVDSDVDSDKEGEGSSAGGTGEKELSEKKKKRLAEMRQLHTMITKEKWPELLALDELTREMRERRVLCGYTALVPSFPPTFKRIRDIGIRRNTLAPDDMDEGRGRDLSEVSVTMPDTTTTEVNRPPELLKTSSDVSTSASPGGGGKAKPREYALSMTPADCSGDSGTEPSCLTKSFYHHKRLPSYTDRILTSSMPGFAPLLEAVSFNSCEDACSSDHKPVLGVFKLTPRTGLKDIMSYSPAFIAQGEPPNVLYYTSSTTYRVKELCAKGLPEMDSQIFGGGSDPYCTFSADPVGILVGNVKKMRTRVISHDLDPVWVGDEIAFRLATNDVAGLSRNCHFLFSVWDYDVGNPDDLIGTAAIPLKDMFEHFGRESGADYPFRLELLRDGQPQGFLHGVLEVDGMKDSASALTYTPKKEAISLYETLKNQNEAAAKNSKLGCQCTVA